MYSITLVSVVLLLVSEDSVAFDFVEDFVESGAEGSERFEGLDGRVVVVDLFVDVVAVHDGFADVDVFAEEHVFYLPQRPQSILRSQCFRLRKILRISMTFIVLNNFE